MDGEKGRTVTITRQELLDVRKRAVEHNGLSLAFLEQMEQRGGSQAVVNWLEEHAFWPLANDWKMWSWLLSE
jgi:hypothetical protein